MANDDGPSKKSDHQVDPGGFGREPVHGSTYDRGGYGRETSSGRNYPGGRGRRGPGYSRGPYMPGPADTGYGQHQTPGHESGPHVGRGPQGYVRSDERMMEDVCERLTWHGEIDASDVRVEVEDGEVTLEGTIEDRRIKRLAEDLAASVRGVYDVHNHLRIPRPST